MGGIGALDHGRELRIADAGLDACGAHRARADANLDDVRTGQDELLNHLTGNHIASLHKQISN